MAIPAEAMVFLGQRAGNRYQVLNYIDQGHFCFVFEALDTRTESVVALKILKPSAQSEGAVEFEREQRLLELLSGSSNVVGCYGGGQDQVIVTASQTGASFVLPYRYMALERADSSLARVLVFRDQVDWTDRLMILRGIVKGVHQMHHTSIVHRDVKSENVLVFSLPRNQTAAKIADLGRSRLTNDSPRLPPEEYFHGRGDLRFAPPELLWLIGEDSPQCWRRVDLYHIGSTLFELGTGQGLTTLALGDWRTYTSRAQKMTRVERVQDYYSRIGEIRARFEAAYALFDADLPKPIAFEAALLLRKLTDPDPARREQLTRFGDRRSPWNMEWLIRRVDILVLLLRTAGRRSAVVKGG